MIRCVDGVLDAIRAHARRGYPDECCGALVGNVSNSGTRHIVRAVPVENERGTERERRYLISPDVVREVERTAAQSALEVLGFYHSHPEAPAQPSAYDRANAWPWYAYVIAEVRSGEVRDVRAWRLADDRSSFWEEELVQWKEDRA
ncbi:MAG: M67 family metallopeptidase [Gemmatimonadetes bacterium]|nr:M67 family metallopeptidase [Gemmatimonadota bacterium]